MSRAVQVIYSRRGPYGTTYWRVVGKEHEAVNAADARAAVEAKAATIVAQRNRPPTRESFR